MNNNIKGHHTGEHRHSANSNVVSSNGGSSIKPVRARTKLNENGDHRLEMGKKNGPILIVGFPGSGLVGSISANYLIESNDMHQIAFIDSEHVIPSAIYIGGKLRHPFRIYADDSRDLYAIVCEAPLRPEGVHTIMNLIVSWALKSSISEVLVLDGVPSKGLPSKHRKPVILSGSSKIKSDPSVTNALLMGLSGGLISACISEDLPCTGVLIPSISGVPDPGGAAILLETISKMPNVPLTIDVQPLREQGQVLKRQLKQFIDSARKQEIGKGQGSLGGSEIYG